MGVEMVQLEENQQKPKFIRNQLLDLNFDGKAHNLRLNHNNQNFIYNMV